MVDIAVLGLGAGVPFIMGEDAWGGLPNLNRLVDAISARPAAQAAVALKEISAFKTEMDEEARRHMFRHLATQAP